jgi:hypothetical protein
VDVPTDGIPSKNKVMVANLPYDLSRENVSVLELCVQTLFCSSPLSWSINSKGRGFGFASEEL